MASSLAQEVKRSIYADPLTKPPLDESFYSLEGEELAFYQSQTGVEDQDALKQHIISVQKEAYKIYGYPCIRSFSFTKLKISRLPAYQSVLKLGRERKDAILLDIGCCFGNDARKIVADGWPVNNVIASDLRQEFWNFGHELFRSTPDAFPAAFIAGDAFDPAIIAPRAPFYDSPLAPRPTLNSLSSLTPLQGHISAIHASSFFHLFGEERQLELAHRIASLLSPVPGSVILGSHGGRREKGWRTEEGGDRKSIMFCHSPESWSHLWNGEVFEKGSVKVEAGLKEVVRIGVNNELGVEFLLLWWSVTRL